ncbi:MAG: hypothetical protein EOO61_05920 [Hymenobacter sp.]|nr:MAG: hypothetical protein EOO61_05920 [Hymenobacter sp.]
MIKYGNGIKRWKEDLMPDCPRYTKKSVEYHYGPPGIGKSTAAVKDYPNAYIKDCDTKWWDNYEGQDCVLLDDFPGKMECVTAKKWLGEVNVPIEIKCGATEMRYTKVMISSNVAPEDCFPNANEVHRAAFRRRITSVFKYAWSSSELTEESRELGYTSERVVTKVS